MTSFSNEQIDDTKIPAIEDIEFILLSKNKRKVNVISTCIFLVLVYGAYWLSSIFVPYVLMKPWIFVFHVAWFLFGFMTLWYAIRSYIHEGFAIREHDIMYKNGIFFKSLIIIPFNRIQHLEIGHGPIDRYFGLANLSIYTAGGSSSDLIIDGLESNTAQTIKNYISDKVSLNGSE